MNSRRSSETSDLVRYRWAERLTRRLEQVLNVHPEKYGGQRSCYTRPPTLRNSPEDDRDKPRSHSEDFSL
ncbi:hypothetical protein WR25_12723 [Diploscapter pachys]|uniref:Uncharacterized protein n=1 Tax=Diploscapter pachys TaxID=2018661 RepID=A0A2A2LL99_9BILA|nr:hypothetical protein WR25_12723 [Diploscapter pachys]